MLRLCCHVSGNGSGRLHRGAASPPRSIDCSLLAQTWYRYLDTSHHGCLKATVVVVIYIYICTYIYVYTYIYIHISINIYTHSCVRLHVVSVHILCCRAGFQVLRGFSTPDCFGCMFVSHPRGCLGAGVCVYIYWSNLHVYAYILQVDTHEVVMCVDRCCTRNSHVSGYIMYIYAGFSCIYLRICVQSSHVWVYAYIYVPKVCMCLCIY